MTSRESWRVTVQTAADFAGDLCDALLMVAGTALALVLTAGYAAYVVLLYWWRQMFVLAGVAVLAWLVLLAFGGA